MSAKPTACVPRRAILSLVVSVLTACAGAHRAGEGPEAALDGGLAARGVDGGAPRFEGAWTLSVWHGALGEAGDPSHVLTLVELGGGVAVVGGAGALDALTFTEDDDGAVRFEGAVELRETNDGGGCPFERATVYPGLELSPRDDDGDGAPDRYEGTGTASESGFAGGVGYTVELPDVRFEAVPDTRDPVLAFAPAAPVVHPFEAVVLEASEPLPPPVLPALLDADGAAVGLVPVAVSGVRAVSTWTLRAGHVLGDRGALLVAADAAVRDFAGRPVARPLPTLTTAPLGDVLDGTFESGTAGGVLVGEAELVGPGSELAPLTGSRSLLLRRGSRLTATVVARVGGDAALVARARLLAASALAPSAAGAVELRAAAAAGGLAARREVPLESIPLEPTGAPGWAFASAPFELRLRLASNPFGRALIDVVVPGLASCGPTSPLDDLALLLDDIRLVSAD